MFVVPAIDIISGTCVRLTQGDFLKPTLYSRNPIEVAKDFEKQGAQLLHVVDLDGAKLGFPVNRETVLAMARAVTIPLQVGGGIRSYDQAKGYLDNGVRKIILSTAGIEDQPLLERLLQNFGNSRIIVSVDMNNGRIATRGWQNKSAQTIRDSIVMLKKMGVTSIIVTDILKDGLLKGPNFDLAKKFVDAGFITMAAGGVSSLSDIQEMNKLGAFGVIVGKAMYEGKINLQEASQAVWYKNNLAKRIIPCLDVRNGRVVKGIHFSNLHDAGDPVEQGKRYCAQGADELIFLDISATLENRKTLCELVARIAKAISIPFTVGGGISSIEDARRLLNAGADKISIGSAAVRNPDVIAEAANYFGSQCIVVSVDAKRCDTGWTVYSKGGTEKTDRDATAFSQQMEQLGAGELLVNSLDQDGTKKGFDIELLSRISDGVNIPVIASSGAGSREDFLTVFQKTSVNAALGASIFHDQEVNIMDLKKFLSNNNMPIRI